MTELSEDQKAKAFGQFMLNLNPIFEPFMMYGLQDLVPGAKQEIGELGLLFAKRMRGRDVPIDHQTARSKARSRKKG